MERGVKEFFAETSLQFWELMAAAIIYIAVRDAHVRPVWKYAARLVASFLIGVGAGPSVASLLGIGLELAGPLLVVFAVLFLDELSNPRLIRAFLKTKAGGDNEP